MTTKLYSIGLVEFGTNKGGDHWFKLVPVYWGEESPYIGDRSGLIEIAWKGRRIVYLMLLWRLSEVFRLMPYCMRHNDESLPRALRSACRMIYLNRLT